MAQSIELAPDFNRCAKFFTSCILLQSLDNLTFVSAAVVVLLGQCSIKQILQKLVYLYSQNTYPGKRPQIVWRGSERYCIIGGGGDHDDDDDDDDDNDDDEGTWMFRMRKMIMLRHTHTWAFHKSHLYRNLQGKLQIPISPPSLNTRP